MSFRVGFPLDGGSLEHSLLVIPQLHLAQWHSCQPGDVSGLRTNSGASFIFQRVSSETREYFRFKFFLFSFLDQKIPPDVRPDNLAQEGSSDAVACALAVAQHKLEAIPEKGSFVVVSGGFQPQDQALGLAGLTCSPLVLDPNQTSLTSLHRKWLISCSHKALAFVVQKEDALLLAQEYKIFCQKLNKNTFSSLKRLFSGQTTLVSYESTELPLLAESLELSPQIFYPRKHFRRMPFSLLRVFGVFVFALLVLVVIFSSYQIEQTQQSLEKIIAGLEQQAQMQNLKEGQITEEANLEKKLGLLFSEVGEIYQQQKKLNQAEIYYKKALLIYEKQKSKELSKMISEKLRKIAAEKSKVIGGE